VLSPAALDELMIGCDHPAATFETDPEIKQYSKIRFREPVAPKSIPGPFTSEEL
jgi:hypothetical protein